MSKKCLVCLKGLTGDAMPAVCQDCWDELPPDARIAAWQASIQGESVETMRQLAEMIERAADIADQERSDRWRLN